VLVLVFLRLNDWLPLRLFYILDGALLTFSGIMLIVSTVALYELRGKARENYENMQRAWGALQMSYIKDFPEGKVPLLLSTRHTFKGAQQARCEFNEKHIVWEDPVNLKTIREMNGHIICLECALLLKLDPKRLDSKLEGVEFPEWFKGGQLVGGELREVVADPVFQLALDVLRKKP
jgi:hypothetical protein